MPDKSDEGGQPSMEKLEREGVQIRKCIAMGESYSNGGNQSGGSKAAKPKASSAPMRKGRSGY